MKKSTESTVLRWGSTPAIHEHMIGHLANQFYCVSAGTRVRELAEELKRVEDIWALGVVDDEGRAVGIVVATQFQERMSRPFAHDVLDRKPIKEVMTKATSFAFDKNLLSVAEALAEEVQRTSNHYYVLEDHKGRFCGIFSTKDLLIHQFREHQADVETAVGIQRAVVPQRFALDRPEFEVYSENKMAKGVGGDFVSVAEHGGTVLVSVCDVSGKGIGASLVTASLGGLFSNYVPRLGLETFVSRVNAYILETFRMEKYLTGAFLEFEPSTGRGVIADMGHAYVGVVRGNDVLKSPPNNPFLGFVAELDVRTVEWHLLPGDLVFLYTDGFAEQRNAQDEEFGVAAVEELLLELRREPLATIAGTLHKRVKKFRGDAPRGDDEAIVLLRYHGPEQPTGAPYEPTESLSARA